MTTPHELRALADRIESGKYNDDPGIGSALVGAAIAAQTNLEGTWDGRPDIKIEARGYQVRVFKVSNPDETIHRFRPPNYLESLDAAILIVPKGGHYACGNCRIPYSEKAWATVGLERCPRDFSGDAATVQAAIAAAALRARAYAMEQ